MTRRYEVGKSKDLRSSMIDRYLFFVEVYSVVTERKLGIFREFSPKGLARKVSKKFSLEEFNEDEVKSKTDKEIKKSLGRFPVSDEELIEFYIEFKRLSE